MSRKYSWVAGVSRGGGAVGRHGQQIALRGQVSSQRHHQPLHLEDVAQRRVVELHEHALLHAVHELVHAGQQGEVAVDRLIDERVQHTIQAARAQLGGAQETRRHHGRRRRRTRRHGHQRPRREERVLGVRLEVVRVRGGRAKPHATHHEEHVAGDIVHREVGHGDLGCGHFTPRIT